MILYVHSFDAPLAQLDRVPVFGTGGSGSNPARGSLCLLQGALLEEEKPQGVSK